MVFLNQYCETCKCDHLIDTTMYDRKTVYTIMKETHYLYTYPCENNIIDFGEYCFMFLQNMIKYYRDEIGMSKKYDSFKKIFPTQLKIN